MDVLSYLLTGAAAAAVVKLLDNLIMWALNRRAVKMDRSEEKAAEMSMTEHKWKAETEKSVQELKGGVRILLECRIRALGNEYLKAGEIDYDDRKFLNEMHHVYHDSLGGNGDLDTLMQDVNELPLKQW